MTICKVIAEIGSTWVRPTPEASKEAALESIRRAAVYGADIIKFQVGLANLYNQERAPEQWQACQLLNLPLNWLSIFQAGAKKNRVDLWVSVFDKAQVQQVARMVDGLKLASGELTETSKSLLTEIAFQAGRHGLPLAFSTGTHTEAEIAQAVAWFRGIPSLNELILMNCASKYPAQDSDYDLMWPLKYRHQLRLGLSDHTLGRTLVSEAVLYGYTYFEKHFCLDNTPQDNPDYGHSLYPAGFAAYVEMVRMAERHITGMEKQLASGEERERVWMQRGSDGRRPRNGERFNLL